MPSTRSEGCEALDRVGSQPIEFEKINTYYRKDDLISYSDTIDYLNKRDALNRDV
jgi:hypothetical protein